MPRFFILSFEALRASLPNDGLHWWSCSCSISCVARGASRHHHSAEDIPIITRGKHSVETAPAYNHQRKAGALCCRQEILISNVASVPSKKGTMASLLDLLVSANKDIDIFSSLGTVNSLLKNGAESEKTRNEPIEKCCTFEHASVQLACERAGSFAGLSSATFEEILSWMRNGAVIDDRDHDSREDLRCLALLLHKAATLEPRGGALCMSTMLCGMNNVCDDIQCMTCRWATYMYVSPITDGVGGQSPSHHPGTWHDLLSPKLQVWCLKPAARDRCCSYRYMRGCRGQSRQGWLTLQRLSVAEAHPSVSPLIL
jgi:hypothetical protein